LWVIPPHAAPRMVWEGDLLRAPSGIRVNPDESLVVVADHVGRAAWSFRIAPDAGLSDGEPFYHLELADDLESGPPIRPGSDGITFDDTGHLYVATNFGIQVCDQPGRVVGIINAPGMERATSVVFGGPDMQTLYATTATRIWKRHLRRKGVLPWQ